MYVDVDFLLALIKDDDWLGAAAEEVYTEHEGDLWTSRLALVELLVVAYRRDRDTERVIANAASLVEVDGGVETVLTAATYVDEHGFTPFDALHLVESGADPIVSSDGSYEGFTQQVDLRDR